MSYGERFWSKVDKRGPDDCWEWTAAKNEYGYGLFYATLGSNKKVRAHRIAYEEMVGPIPEGLVIDHLCRNESCVNPTHMEPVTIGENVRRGRAVEARQDRARAQTLCKNGHPLSGDNLYMTPAGTRRCRTCHRETVRRYAERKKAVAA